MGPGVDPVTSPLLAVQTSQTVAETSEIPPPAPNYTLSLVGSALLTQGVLYTSSGTGPWTLPLAQTLYHNILLQCDLVSPEIRLVTTGLSSPFKPVTKSLLVRCPSLPGCPSSGVLLLPSPTSLHRCSVPHGSKGRWGSLSSRFLGGDFGRPFRTGTTTN